MDPGGLMLNVNDLAKMAREYYRRSFKFECIYTKNIIIDVGIIFRI